MTRPRRPDPPPLQTDDTLVAAVGAVAFAVAFVVLLFVPLAPQDHWWRWVCVTGFAMGIFGYWYIPRLHKGRAEAAARRAADRPES
jgi:H+/Cl- antiporter ClcA